MTKEKPLKKIEKEILKRNKGVCNKNEQSKRNL